MKILILSVSAGNGHVKAAQAVNDEFVNNYNDVEVKIVDTLKYINPMVDKLIIGSYLKSLKSTPSLYAKLYEYAGNEDNIWLSAMVNDILSIKIKTLLAEYNPDVVLCTHPFPLEMLSILKRKKKTTVPVAAILTDYAPHSFWFYDYIDAYIIPHEDFIQDLIDKGISKETIYPLGIPVSSSFIDPIDKLYARHTLKLDENKLTLLLMGGGLGMGNIKSIFETLAFSSLDIQMVTCTGNNLRLRNQLLNIDKRCNKNNIIIDYSNQISLFMSAADILITKPGGLTIAESIIKNIPIIISSAIPGQEEKNADYLLNNGIAARVRNSDEIVSILKQLIKSPTRINNMKQSCIEKSKPNAAKDICNLLFELGHKNNPE